MKRKYRGTKARMRAYLKRHGWGAVELNAVQTKFKGEKTPDELKGYYDELVDEHNKKWLEVW